MEGERPFGREHRLRTQSDIAQVRESGNKYVGRLCVVGMAEAADGQRRVVFITSRRYHKHAVVRNRARRLFREAYRQLCPKMRPAWLALVPRRHMERAKMPEVLAELQEAGRRLGFLAEGS